ncbi:MAG: hypothetical protein U0798_11145 [Gemmataceae bacterium]
MELDHAIRLIRAAGGFSIHNGRTPGEFDDRVYEDLAARGLDGIEVRHPSASNTQIDFLQTRPSGTVGSPRPVAIITVPPMRGFLSANTTRIRTNTPPSPIASINEFSRNVPKHRRSTGRFHVNLHVRNGRGS